MPPQESVTHAKASVQLGFSDAEAWLGLGNAYVTVYFQATRVASDLDRALQAYARAEANGPEIPDVYYGRAQVLRFREDYQGAMTNFRRAAELDPSLPGAQEADDIQSWLVRVADLVTRQGRIKQKVSGQVGRGELVAGDPGDRDHVRRCLPSVRATSHRVDHHPRGA